MDYLAIEKNLSKNRNLYETCVVASKRARLLNLGVSKAMETDVGKLTTHALLETLADKIKYAGPKK